jgi:hypothetical protein
VESGLRTWEPLKPLMLLPFRFLVLSCYNPGCLIEFPVVLGVFFDILKLPHLHLFLYVFMSYKLLLCSVNVLKWFSSFIYPPIMCVPSCKWILYCLLENIGSTWPLFHTTEWNMCVPSCKGILYCLLENIGSIWPLFRTTEWKFGLCGNSCLKLVCF